MFLDTEQKPHPNDTHHVIKDRNLPAVNFGAAVVAAAAADS